MRICKFCATSGAITNASECVRRLQTASSFMNARTATVLEADKDVQAARNATRGILIAASKLRAADSADLRSRAAKVAAVAAAHAAAVDGDSRFPEKAITAARTERLLGIAVPRELGGEGAGIADVVDV